MAALCGHCAGAWTDLNHRPRCPRQREGSKHTNGESQREAETERTGLQWQVAAAHPCGSAAARGGSGSVLPDELGPLLHRTPTISPKVTAPVLRSMSQAWHDLARVLSHCSFGVRECQWRAWLGLASRLNRAISSGVK